MTKKPTADEPAAPKGRRNVVPGKEQISIYVSMDVGTRLRVAAAQDRKKLSEIAEELLVAGLDAREKKRR
jgi:hypothetical protein